jgi:hypothetical protein
VRWPHWIGLSSAMPYQGWETKGFGSQQKICERCAYSRRVDKVDCLQQRTRAPPSYLELPTCKEKEKGKSARGCAWCNPVQPVKHSQDVNPKVVLLLLSRLHHVAFNQKVLHIRARRWSRETAWNLR